VKICVCDDDKYICSHLDEIINEISNDFFEEKLEVDIFYSSIALNNYIKTNHAVYDLIFLDIEFSDDMNGVELGNTIRKFFKVNTTQIVFISGNKEYALQLFKIQPLDFLIKPFKYDDIFLILKTVYELRKEHITKVFTYAVGQSSYNILINDIIFFESRNRIVNMITSEKMISFYSTLNKVNQQLHSLNFIRIHKSYLINFEHIIEVQYEQVSMSGSHILPISQNKRKIVRTQIRSLLMTKKG